MDYNELKKLIVNNGFDLDDKRLNLKKIELNLENINNKESEILVIRDEINQNNLISNIVCGNITINNWSEFVNDIISIFNRVKQIDDGHVASYIPQLANVNPDLFALTICTVDGQILQLGDINAYFSVQSCSKPVTYGIAVESNSENHVYNFIGREPSGKNFNELVLNNENIPHNPLINSGAIVATSLIKHNCKQAERFEFIINYWKRLIGNKVGFSNTVYLSEKDTADRNKALAYMMQEKKVFSHGKSKEQVRDWNNGDLEKNLELYFQNCSIECNVTDLAKLASTLANGGVNVFTNDKVFSSDNVKNILSLMYSCGMYDYSGEWSYLMGIPAKSGVSGIIYSVIPNIMGIAVYSPKLDTIGNSVKGIKFFKEFTKFYSVHKFDSPICINTKKPLTKENKYSKNFNTYLLLDASSKGDINTVQQLIASNIDINSVDYDNRSALHLACNSGNSGNSGNSDLVTYLLDHGASLNIKDRWNHTPLDDATTNNLTHIINLLKTYNIKH